MVFGTPCTYPIFKNFSHDPNNKTKHLGTKNCIQSVKSPFLVGHPQQKFLQLKLIKHLKLILSMSVNKMHEKLTRSTVLCPKNNHKLFPDSKLAAFLHKNISMAYIEMFLNKSLIDWISFNIKTIQYRDCVNEFSRIKF